MTTIDDLCRHLEQIAPNWLAEDWDNVGLLIGDRSLPVQNVMTCLTVTPTTAQEAIDSDADLVVTHHPLPFRATKRITTDTVGGSMLWQLARAGVCVYSAHTAFDSATGGINQQWATQLGLEHVSPLNPLEEFADANSGSPLGSGRCGNLPGSTTLEQLAKQVKSVLRIKTLRLVGNPSQSITKLGVACGSGGTFLAPAIKHHCDCLLTGEATFHTCLEAEANNIAMILPGHYASERFAMEQLAADLASTFSSLKIWASRTEADPLTTL